MSSCPGVSQLQLLLQEKLAADDLRAVETHLDDCPICQEILEQLTQGPPERFQGDKSAAVDSQPLPFLPGYHFLDQIGQGGMGVVFLARDIRLQRSVAVKMLNVAGYASPILVERLRQEAATLARVKHPNIVPIYQIEEIDGRPCLILEYVDGPNLAQVERGRPQPPHDSAALLEILARAVHAAHLEGIIHRDLKPANILLSGVGRTTGETTNGQELARKPQESVLRTCVPKITDFGLAKRLGEEKDQTGTGAILGTPSYMAPEQARGKTHEVRPAIDIYALGAILYDLLTGRPPFCGETPLDTVLQVQHDDPVPPRRLQPKVPVDLETICLKCLHKEPERRYLTAMDLADDLRRFAQHEPIRARPVRLPERMRKWARRRPAVAVLLGLLLAVVVGGFSGMFLLWQRAEILRGQAEDAEAVAEDNERKARLKAGEALQAAKEARLAEQDAREANQKSQRSLDYARRTLYDANMNLAQDAFVKAKVSRLSELLEGQVPANGGPNLRGFEWNYLRGLYHSERLALKSHVQLVRGVAFRPPAGQQLASGSGDGTVILWTIDGNPQAKEQKAAFRFLTGPQGPVRAVVFSEDGRWLAAAAEDNTVHVWDLGASGLAARKLTGHQHWVNGAAFSPDGKWLASAGEDQTVRVWDLEKSEEVACLKGSLYGVLAVAFSPDGRRLAAGGMDRKVRVWDIASREEIIPALTHKHWVTCVTFSKDGKHLVSAGWEDRLRVWNAERGTLEFELDGLASPVRQVAFSPDGRRMACTCLDYSVAFWDLVRQKLVRSLPAEKGLVRSVTFSRDGEFLASFHFDQLIPEPPARVAPSLLWTVGFGADSRHLATGSVQGNILVWDLAAETGCKEIAAHAGPVRTLTYSPGRQEWASAGEDGMICLWGPDWKRTKSFKAHERWIHALAFCPTRPILASASADHTIALWDLETKTAPVTLKGHNGPVLAVAYDAGGTLLASGSADHSVRLWKADGSTATDFQGKHQGPVTSVAFHPRGRQLASASWDRTVKIWDADTGKLLHTLRGHTHGVSTLAYSPDGTRLASGSEDATIKIWDLDTGQETLTLESPNKGITSLAFSPDGSRLAAASWDNSLAVWEGVAGK